MAGLTIVRRLSRIVEYLTERPWSGERPTGGWQDKSRSPRSGRPAAGGWKINDLA